MTREVQSDRMTIENVMRQIQGFAFDMDGVLYRGNLPMPFARELLTLLEHRGIPHVLVTNNSTKTPRQYAEKLAGMGITVAPERILTSGLVTRAWLEQHYPRGTSIFVIGMDALAEALFADGYFVPATTDAAVVVSGADFTLTYEKLKIATLAIRRGATYVATNPDRTFPAEEGLIPGAGAIVAAIHAATDVQPTVIGKPEPAMLLQAAALIGCPPSHVLMVGDRLDTDVLAGQRCGMRTALVLTGVTTAAEASSSALVPDLVLPDLGLLYQALMDDRG